MVIDTIEADRLAKAFAIAAEEARDHGSQFVEINDPHHIRLVDIIVRPTIEEYGILIEQSEKLGKTNE